MPGGRPARLLPAIALLAISPGSALAVQRETRVDALEVRRTDPADVRTPAGQWAASRDARLDALQTGHGIGWRLRWNELTGTPHRAFGGQIPASEIAAGIRPQGPRDKEAILRLAESFVRAHTDLLAARWEDLRPVFAEFKGGRWSVMLQQQSRGIEVVGGRVDLRFSADGDLTLFGADFYPVPEAEPLPRIGAAGAIEAARRGMPVSPSGVPSSGASPWLASPGSGDDAAPELVFLPMLAGEPSSMAWGARKAARRAAQPAELRVRPAYRVRVRTADPPGDWITYVDAATGEVLWRYNLVRFAAASGTVTGDIHPLQGTDPLQTVPFPENQIFGGDPADVIATYDFESGKQGWSGQSPWALASESVHGGTQAWSDSPGAMYADARNLTLVSPKLDLAGAADPVLSFWVRMQVEDTWDFLYVEVSPDNGSTWRTLRALSGSSAWHEERVDLAAVEGGSNVRVRFRFSSDASVHDDGCWVDDVVIARLGSAVTDAAGHYALTTTGSTATVTAGLRGPFAQVSNRGGAAIDASAVVTPAGGVANLRWMSTNSRSDERDTFYALHVAHARIKALDPSFTALDYPLPVFVGIVFCNAYWAGEQIVMGSGGSGCANFGNWLPVVMHEYGHGVTHFVYGPAGDPPGEMNEAFSDYFGSTISGDPRVGTDIQGPGTLFRTLDNTLRTPEDLGGEIHIDGAILAGALWDMRRNLLPDVDLADSLFHFARYGFPKNFEDYFLEILSVDDNDANLGNGTPHLQAIRSAFGAHGIGLGPEFGYVAARVQDPTGNGDGRLDAGETAELRLTLHNFGGAETGVAAHLATSTPGVTVLTDSIPVGAVGAGADVTPAALFRVQVAANVPLGTAVRFDLLVESSAGATSDRFMLPVGYVPILLVDDDRTRNFEPWFLDSLARLGQACTRWEAGILGSPTAEQMSGYRAVLWFTASDNKTTLTPGDQAELAAYLGAGGNLFITGQDIGEDLWRGASTTPSAADKAFYETWLHAKVDVEGESGPPSVTGVAGDVVGNGLAFSLNGGTSANNQNSPSSLLPQTGAVAALRYSNGRIAALRYAGAYRLFYAGYGFEGIRNASERDTMMARALGWLMPRETRAPQVRRLAPNGGEKLFRNDITTIRWTATDSIAVVSVRILLSTNGGQSFAPIASNLQNRFAWDWTVPDAASGSCLVRVEATDPSGNVGDDTSDRAFTISAATDGGRVLPRRFALYAATPNPFNPTTALHFDLPQPARVWLDVMTVDGRRVRSLSSGTLHPAGTARVVWDGRDDRGIPLASGVYLVHFRADAFESTRKVQLLK